MGRKRNFYIVRLWKDDSIVAVGNAEECVKSLGLSNVSVFRTMVSRCRNNSKKYKKYDVDIVPEVEDEE